MIVCMHDGSCVHQAEFSYDCGVIYCVCTDCQLNLPIASELVGAPGVYLTAPYYLPMESEFQCIYTLKFAADADASKAMVLSFLSVDLANSVIHVKSSSQENVFGEC